MRQFVSLAALLSMAWWGLADQTATADRPAASGSALAAVKVFVANGSGDASDVTDNLNDVIRCLHLPWAVETVVWTSTLGAFKDHADIANHCRWASYLAGRVTACRQTCPGAKIYLMGHSSGTHVVLKAAEALPPGTSDRIVLLAPSVSCTYDLRPALRACREGIDCYYSQEDGILDFAVDHMGSADGKKIIAAGQIGFKMPRPPFPEHEQYYKLRQFPWNVNVEWTRHHGGHLGATQADFLKYYVLPIMVTPWQPPVPR